MQQNVCTVGIELAKNIWAVSHDSREADRSTSRRSRTGRATFASPRSAGS